MAVIVASVFLPYTINFDSECEAASPSRRSQQAQPDQDLKNQHSAPMSIPVPPKQQQQQQQQEQQQAVDGESSNPASPSASASIPDILSNMNFLKSNPTSGQSTPAGGSPSDSFFYNAHVRPPSSRASTSPEASPPQLTSNLRKLALQPQSRAEALMHSNVLSKPPSPRPYSPQHAVSRSHVATHKAATTEPFQERNFNETPWNVELQHGGNGGLKNSITRAVETKRMEEVKWVGTLGMPTDELEKQSKNEIEREMVHKHENYPIFVDDTTFDGHYNHYCKQILWPTLHYQVPDNPKDKAYEDHSWEHYKRLNQVVADRVVQLYQKGDVIWINDYHLLLVPEMVRQRVPEAKIGLFLHVAFPSSEVFRCLACRTELLEGMLGANCVGFQISEYSRHFLQTCNRLLAVDTTPVGVRTENKFINVTNNAIGIDPESLHEQLYEEEVQNWREKIRERWPDQKLIVSRDKLDHIRGIKQKLLAYELFLKENPQWIENAVLIQVCLSGVTDPELDAEISTIVDRINSMRSNLAGTMPVILLQQDIDFVTYLALLSEADVFCVCSLREGMNLTCHEFVYCNQSVKGPLILSEFTGAASVLGDASLLVNPWDKRQVAKTFLQAVEMPMKDREKAYSTLFKHVTEQTGGDWAVAFIKAIQESWDEEQRRRINSMHRLDLKKFRGKYQHCKEKRLFLLNLDSGELTTGPAKTDGGTPVSANSSATDLSSMTTVFKQSSLTTSYISTQRKILVLNELLSDPSNIVYVMSSDSKAMMERTYSRVTNLGLIAEDGGFVKPSSHHEWITFADLDRSKEWQQTVRPMVESVSERLPGSWIQTNDCSMYFHVNSVLINDPDRAGVILGEFINHINDAFHQEHIRARLHSGKVVIYDELVSKVKVVQNIYNSVQKEVGFLFVASEGAAAATEEDDHIFEWANSLVNVDVCTVTIGSNGTLAQWATEGVNSLLNSLLAASRVTARE